MAPNTQYWCCRRSNMGNLRALGPAIEQPLGTRSNCLFASACTCTSVQGSVLGVIDHPPARSKTMRLHVFMCSSRAHCTTEHTRRCRDRQRRPRRFALPLLLVSALQLSDRLRKCAQWTCRRMRKRIRIRMQLRQVLRPRSR